MSDKITYILEVLDKYSFNTKKFQRELLGIKRASDSVNKSLARTNLNFKAFTVGTNMKRMVSQVNSLARGLEKVDHSTKRIARNRMLPSSGAESGGRRPIYAGGGSAGVSFGGVGKAMGYYAVIDKVIGMPREILDTKRAMDSLGATLEAVLPKYDRTTDAATLAGREIEYLKKTTYDLGLDFNSTRKEYAKFLAAGSMGGASLKEMRKQFEAFAKLSTVYQLPAHRFGLVMNAITQMTSKGVVSMEELKRQLGDSLPGALTIFAKAAIKARPDIFNTIGDFIKMVEQGKVSADILNAVADTILEDTDLMNGLDKALESTNSKLNRLSNSWTMFLTSLSEGESGKIMGDMIVGLDNMLKSTKMLVEDFSSIYSYIKKSGDSKLFTMLSMAGNIVAAPYNVGKFVGDYVTANALTVMSPGSTGRTLEEALEYTRKSSDEKNKIGAFLGKPESFMNNSINNNQKEQKIILEIFTNNLPNNMSVAPTENNNNNIRVNVKRGMTLMPTGGNY